MSVVSINVPEEIFIDLHEDKDDFTEYMKKTVALDLYKNKKVSLGYCASVAGMTKEEFVQYLAENGISIFSF
jgi:predicted HTH domain antitoxin